LEKGKIVLLFPECPDPIQLLGPNRCGRRIEVEVLGASAMRLDNIVLAKDEK